MRPRKLSSESWKEALKFINKCPLCNTGYEAEQAALFAKHEAANLVHITCKNCRSYFMAMIVMLGQGLSSVGMITDLSFADVERLHRVELGMATIMASSEKYLQMKKLSRKKST
jgi:hypothetical protein